MCVHAVGRSAGWAKGGGRAGGWACMTPGDRSKSIT